MNCTSLKDEKHRLRLDIGVLNSQILALTEELKTANAAVKELKFLVSQLQAEAVDSAASAAATTSPTTTMSRLSFGEELVRAVHQAYGHSGVMQIPHSPSSGSVRSLEEAEMLISSLQNEVSAVCFQIAGKKS